MTAPRGAAGVLFALALAVRLWHAISSSFDGLYGQDAYAYYQYALALFDAPGRGELPPPFWWPLGYPALLNVAFFIGGAQLFSAQAITLLCGALVAPVAFALAYEIAPSAARTSAAWTAGLLCVISGQLVQSSVVIMADAPALFFATTGAWLLVTYARVRRPLLLILSSAAAGLAVWTRWQNLVFLGVWFLTLLVIQTRARPAGAGSERQPVRALAPVLLALAVVALVLLPQLLIRAATNAPFAGQSWLEGWSPLHFSARVLDNVDGHFEYPLPVAVFYGQVFVHPAYLVVLLTPLFLLGIRQLIHALRGAAEQVAGLRVGAVSMPASMLLLGWILFMFLFLAGIPYENFRFALGLFSPIAVVTGLGAGWLWERWGASRSRRLLVGWIAVACLVMLVWQPRVLAPVLNLKERELDRARWLTEQLPQGALVWTLGMEGALKQYTGLSVETIWQTSEQQILVASPSFLFVDRENLAGQWRGTEPERLLQSLESGGHLTPLGTRADYSLFRVEP
jgi:hypothetical protein